MFGVIHKQLVLRVLRGEPPCNMELGPFVADHNVCHGAEVREDEDDEEDEEGDDEKPPPLVDTSWGLCWGLVGRVRGGLRIRRYNARGGLGTLSSHGRECALAPSQILAHVRARELKRILPKTHVLASSSTCADLKQRRWAIDGASHQYHSQHPRHHTRHHPTTQPGNQHRQGWYHSQLSPTPPKTRKIRKAQRAGAAPHGAHHPRAQLIPPHLRPYVRSPASVGGLSAAINLRRAVDMGMVRVRSQTTAKSST